MIHIGYRYAAAYYTFLEYANATAYLMTGPVPTEMPTNLDRTLPHLWNEDNCIGSFALNSQNVAEGRVAFNPVEHDAVNKVTKGWHRHDDGIWYYWADKVTLSNINQATPKHASMVSIQGTELTGISNTFSTGPQIEFETDQPIKVDTLKTCYYFWGDVEYWDGNAWVVIGNKPTNGTTDIPLTEVTASRFRYFTVQWSEWYSFFARLGHTTQTPTNDNTLHNITHAIIVTTAVTPTPNPWGDSPGNDDISAIMVEVGSPGQNKPMILDTTLVRRGDSPSLMSCELVFSELGNGII